MFSVPGLSTHCGLAAQSLRHVAGLAARAERQAGTDSFLRPRALAIGEAAPTSDDSCPPFASLPARTASRSFFFFRLRFGAASSDGADSAGAESAGLCGRDGWLARGCRATKDQRAAELCAVVRRKQGLRVFQGVVGTSEGIIT